MSPKSHLVLQYGIIIDTSAVLAQYLVLGILEQAATGRNGLDGDDHG